MTKIPYIQKRFNRSSQTIIEQANEIIETYMAQGYKLTLRQLYYQFVSRALIQNSQKEYKRIGSIINDGRLAGQIDWQSIEDRTRNLEVRPRWDAPANIIKAAATQYHIDMWAAQTHRIEVWIEKEALAGVFDRICRAWDVPYLCCRGYTSQSEMWSASMRIREYLDKQTVVILHFGDHDPSGIDMSRDIEDRLKLFGCYGLQFERIALNMDQVKQYNPPPNPAKETDARFEGYIRDFGHESWELDALEPSVLEALVTDNVQNYLEADKWKRDQAREARERVALERVSERWDEVSKLVRGTPLKNKKPNRK